MQSIPHPTSGQPLPAGCLATGDEIVTDHSEAGEDSLRRNGDGVALSYAERRAWRAKTMWKHLRAIVLLPGIVTLVLPGSILWRAGTDSFGLWQSSRATRVVLPVIGAFCICLGLLLMFATIRLFVTVGKGTLAPWEPAQRLVVLGVYRHVRNPMISGVILVLLGESVLTASLPLFCWFLVFAFVNAIYIPLLEEPGLVKRFGEAYLSYKRNRPRWTPWDSEAGDAS